MPFISFISANAIVLAGSWCGYGVSYPEWRVECSISLKGKGKRPRSVCSMDHINPIILDGNSQVCFHKPQYWKEFKNARRTQKEVERLVRPSGHCRIGCSDSHLHNRDFCCFGCFLGKKFRRSYIIPICIAARWYWSRITFLCSAA